jgi:hypothetical protein
MNFAILCVIAIVATAPFGLAFLLAPETTGSVYGIAGWTAGTLSVARLLGVGFLFMAGAVYAARQCADSDFQRRLATCFSLASLLGAIVSGYSTASGALNAVGWTAAALYAFFTLAWGSVALRRRA